VITYGIDPKIGTKTDFSAFMARAKAMNYLCDNGPGA
jgi:hypothetical protein